MDSERRADARTAAAVLGIAAGTCATLLYGAYNKVLKPIAHVLVITSVIAVPAGYLLRRRVDRKSNLKKSADSIMLIANDIEQSLGEGSDADFVNIVVKKGGNRYEINFHLVYMGYSGLDSVIHSGHLALFPPELQRTLNDMHVKIDTNNRMMDQYRELTSLCVLQGVGPADNRYFEVMLST